MGLKQATVKLGVDLKAFNTGLQKAQKSLKKVGKSFTKVGKNMTVGLTAPLTAFAAASVAAFDKQAQSEAKLLTALKGNKEAFNSLTQAASEFQNVSTFGDEEIIEQQAYLASLGMTEDQINKVISAAMDLSAGTGKTLQFGVLNLAKTFGGLTGELGESLPALKNLTVEQLKAGEAIDLVANSFRGQAKAAALAGAGPLKQLQNSFGDLMEQIGGMIIPVINKLVKFLLKGVNAFTSLDKGVKIIIIAMAGILAAIGPAIFIFGKLQLAIAALSWPIVGTIAVIAALVAAILYVSENWQAISERADIAFAHLRNGLIALLQFFIKNNIFSWMIEGLNGVLKFFGKETIPNPFEDVAEGLEEFKVEVPKAETEFKGFFESIKDGAKKATDSLKGLAEGVGVGGQAAKKSREKQSTVSLKNAGFSGLDTSAAPVVPIRVQPVVDVSPLDVLKQKLFNISETVVQFADQFSGAFGQAFDLIGSSIDNQMVKLDNYYNKQKALINNSQKTEEQKQKALEKLDKKVAKKKAALQRKQAIADKARAIFEATINTASQVAKVIANPILAAVVAGLGAAQIATIAAAPIPAFADGGLVFGPTMGLVGEGIGTTRSNPEVIAPLDKLTDFMGNGKQHVIVTGRIDGQDILLSSEKALQNRSRLR